MNFLLGFFDNKPTISKTMKFMQGEFTCILCTQIFRGKESKMANEIEWPGKFF